MLPLTHTSLEATLATISHDYIDEPFENLLGKIPNGAKHLAFLAVRIAEDYSDNDVSTALAVLTDTEKDYLARIIGGYHTGIKCSNDRKMQLIASIIDSSEVLKTREENQSRSVKIKLIERFPSRTQLSISHV